MADAKWNEAGEPENLEAAAADADKWLKLIETFTYAGTWKFSNPDSRARLRGCREQLTKFLAAPEGGEGGK